MKILLDENLPKRLKLDFEEHEIYTVFDKGWNSEKNGELLQLMLEEGFDMLFTFDKNIQYQQNFAKYPLTVIILNAKDNAYVTLQELVPEIRKLLQGKLLTGPIEVRAKL